MTQKVNGWAVGAAVVGVIALAGASGAFNDHSGSAASYPVQSAAYGTQPAYGGYAGYNAPVQPTYQSAAPSYDSDYSSGVGPSQAEVQREWDEWKRYTDEHPAGSVGNPYDQ